MGNLRRSENSLNQHIKLKHSDFSVKKIKKAKSKEDYIYCEEKEENGKGEDFEFKRDNMSIDNKDMDFGKILENLWIE
jgi:hypothetical protein